MQMQYCMTILLSKLWMVQFSSPKAAWELAKICFLACRGSASVPTLWTSDSADNSSLPNALPAGRLPKAWWACVDALCFMSVYWTTRCCRQWNIHEGLHECLQLQGTCGRLETQCLGSCLKLFCIAAWSLKSPLCTAVELVVSGQKQFSQLPINLLHSYRWASYL